MILETKRANEGLSGLYCCNNVNLKNCARNGARADRSERSRQNNLFPPDHEIYRPTSGRIFYKGSDITNAKPAALARLGLVRSFQISATFPHLTVLENVRVALQRKTAMSYCFWKSDRVLDQFNERARQLLADVGLEDHAESEAAELSYGRKRALEIATTIAMDPEMLLLDEPTAGMGHEDVASISALIRTAAKNRTVLMVEHNLSIVADLSDR
jgi:branched-chain amino acid transport system ATP-binding protein